MSGWVDYRPGDGHPPADTRLEVRLSGGPLLPPAFAYAGEINWDQKPGEGLSGRVLAYRGVPQSEPFHRRPSRSDRDQTYIGSGRGPFYVRYHEGHETQLMSRESAEILVHLFGGVIKRGQPSWWQRLSARARTMMGF